MIIKSSEADVNNDDHMFNNDHAKDETNTVFQLPIYFLSKKQSLAEHMKADLELLDIKGPGEAQAQAQKAIYETVFQATTLYGKHTLPLWASYYTTDKAFLTDSQKLIKALYKQKNAIGELEQEAVHTIWTDIEKETGFVEKYHYMDWGRFKELNNNAGFLQLLSLYNMTSPLLSLAVPIFFMIFPFVILKIQGIPITFGKYTEVMKMLFKQHQLGQIFQLGAASWDKMIYIVASFGFYIVQVYQNITSCVKYYYNMKKIHAQLFTMRDYVAQTLKNMTLLETLATDLKSYRPFFTHMATHKTVLEKLSADFAQVVPNGFSLAKIKQIGHVMKCFYQLYNKAEYHDAFRYSFGLNGYIDNLRGLGDRYAKKQINACKFHKGASTGPSAGTKFTNAYYPALVDKHPVKNSYALNKHLLITGPNAAGKTTLLKTTILNVLLSQQTGFGFYQKAKILLYDHIHCYINIPDTSARDSLFQAEARRCKDILTCITANADARLKPSLSPPQTHLCVFDELYSGTNPYEAIGSAYAFLSYLNKYPTVNFVLTTHFLDLCKKFERTPHINNYHMEVEEKGDDILYTYKMKKNISTIKGGVKVLRDLDYPAEIIQNTMAVIKELA